MQATSASFSQRLQKINQETKRVEQRAQAITSNYDQNEKTMEELNHTLQIKHEQNLLHAKEVRIKKKKAEIKTKEAQLKKQETMMEKMMKSLESQVKVTATQLQQLQERETKFFSKLRVMEMKTQSLSRKRKREEEEEEEEEEEDEEEEEEEELPKPKHKFPKQRAKRDLPCPHCKRMFTAKRYVTIHVNAHHADQSGK